MYNTALAYSCLLALLVTMHFVNGSTPSPNVESTNVVNRPRGATQPILLDTCASDMRRKETERAVPAEAGWKPTHLLEFFANNVGGLDHVAREPVDFEGGVLILQLEQLSVGVVAYRDRRLLVCARPSSRRCFSCLQLALPLTSMRQNSPTANRRPQC